MRIEIARESEWGIAPTTENRQEKKEEEEEENHSKKTNENEWNVESLSAECDIYSMFSPFGVCHNNNNSLCL